MSSASCILSCRQTSRTCTNYNYIFRVFSRRKNTIRTHSGFRIQHTSYTPVIRHKIFWIIKFHTTLCTSKTWNDIFDYTCIHFIWECRITNRLTSKCYGITIPTFDCCFNCIRVMEQADGDNRDIYTLFYSSCGTKIPSGLPCCWRYNCFPCFICTCGDI